MIDAAAGLLAILMIGLVKPVMKLMMIHIDELTQIIQLGIQTSIGIVTILLMVKKLRRRNDNDKPNE